MPGGCGAARSAFRSQPSQGVAGQDKLRGRLPTRHASCTTAHIYERTRRWPPLSVYPLAAILSALCAHRNAADPAQCSGARHAHLTDERSQMRDCQPFWTRTKLCQPSESGRALGARRWRARSRGTAPRQDRPSGHRNSSVSRCNGSCQ